MSATVETARIPARKVKPGLTVLVDGVPGEWTVLSHHPENCYWWLHRWEAGEWQTSYARYSELTQVIR